MSIVASAILWHGLVRFLLFWLVVAFGLFVLPSFMPYSNWSFVFTVLGEAGAGHVEQVSNKFFAFALSSAIVQVALALALAFLVTHVLLLRAALSGATRALGPAHDLRGFATRFDTISDDIRGNAVIGHAWHEFEETAVREVDAIRNTVRPQVFINLADARERLFGLKMMASIPGFFVGLGLLLTFIGLVLALNKAAGSTGAASAVNMTQSLNELLGAATFKFSTSIAGLGASLMLSLLFRTYQIWIESGFARFGRAVEARMLFHPTQRIAAESRDILAAQRDELKEINSERFFARLGESVGPGIKDAMRAALGPVTERLDNTMEKLTQSSQGGLNEMLKEFQNTLRGGAGIELVAIAKSLDSARGALDGIQQNLAGSGVDFSRRLTEASQTMGRVVAEAGQTLGGSASSVVDALETAMSGAAQKLNAQTAAFGDALADLQASYAAQAQASARASQEAGEVAATASRQVMQQAADASTQTTREVLETVRAGMSDVVTGMRDDIARLSETLRSVSSAFASHTQNIETASARSRDTAEAFGLVAKDVRSVSQPLLAHAERVANSTDRMASSMASSVATLSSTQEAAGKIAAQLSAHVEQIGRIWDQYEKRFKGVDEDLGKAAERFHAEVSRHQEAMREFVKTIDQHTGSVLGKIGSAVIGLGDSVESLNETLDGFPQKLIHRVPAE